jgi:hypothetical protein
MGAKLVSRGMMLELDPGFMIYRLEIDYNGDWMWGK